MDAYPSPDGHYAASSYTDGSILIWNLLTDQVVTTLTGHKGPATSVAISPDGKWLASAGNDGEILLWAMNKILQPSVQAQPYLRLEGHTGRIHSVRFDPDSQRVITASVDGTVRIFPVTPEEYLQEAKAMMKYRPDHPYLERPRKSNESPRKSNERK